MMTNYPKIIHEDASLLVLDKPAGMPSVSLNEGEPNTIAAWLIKKHPEQKNIEHGNLEAGLCHRLDNDTSGLLIAARTQATYELIRAQFETGDVKKEYLALVIGTPPDKGTIVTPIAHHPQKDNKMVACESAARTKEWKGRPALTTYSALKRYAFYEKGKRTPTAHYSLLLVKIETGVRHQIRVHFAHIGHPLAGDVLYQNPAKRAEDPLLIERHFLHSSKLAFRHPATNNFVEFESHLPEDLLMALKQLREH